MTYTEAVNWLYAAVPNFQRDGGGNNYKIGLEGPEALWNYLERPSDAIPTIRALTPSNINNLNVFSSFD